MTEWAAKPDIFTVWPFTEKICGLYAYTLSLFYLPIMHSRLSAKIFTSMVLPRIPDITFILSDDSAMGPCAGCETLPNHR